METMVENVARLESLVIDLGARTDALAAKANVAIVILGGMLVLVALKLFLDHRKLAANQVRLSERIEALTK